jgi:molybdenum-dependent DNA-binding transcriptional regulator ModE
LALSRDLNVSYKRAFVLLHKLREAMAAELKGRVVGGEGKTAADVVERGEQRLVEQFGRADEL